jgi:uncharacterized protein (UPF0335 family)
MADKGHNSGINAAHLKAFIERIERLEEEKRALADDVKEVYAEVKGSGYDTAIVRKVVALRRKDREKLKEEQVLLDMYATALGMDIFG